MIYADFKFPIPYSITEVGVVPDFQFINITSREHKKLRFWLCLKQTNIDVVTFATDLRAPFMVISPEFAMVSVNISVTHI